MNNDPILSAIQIRIERVLLFVIWALALSTLIWLLVLLGYFNYSFASVWQLTKEAYLANEQNRVAALILRGCGVVGILTTSVVFLVAALWWNRSGDVHRRGAQFIDARDGRS